MILIWKVPHDSFDSVFRVGFKSLHTGKEKKNRPLEKKHTSNGACSCSRLMPFVFLMSEVFSTTSENNNQLIGVFNLDRKITIS